MATSTASTTGSSSFDPSNPDLSYFTDCKTAGCPGHVAGWMYAYNQGITDPGDCDGKSDDFIEGCTIYCTELAANA